MSDHRPPRSCPVCGETLHLTRLSCQGCGTELTGDFENCEFCSLRKDELEVLKIFLSSRGNMKALERQLGVSYPTARARLDTVLSHLGMEATGAQPVENPLELLRALARGELDLGEAAERLTHLG